MRSFLSSCIALGACLPSIGFNDPIENDLRNQVAKAAKEIEKLIPGADLEVEILKEAWPVFFRAKVQFAETVWRKPVSFSISLDQAPKESPKDFSLKNGERVFAVTWSMKTQNLHNALVSIFGRNPPTSFVQWCQIQNEDSLPRNEYIKTLCEQGLMYLQKSSFDDFLKLDRTDRNNLKTTNDSIELSDSGDLSFAPLGRVRISKIQIQENRFFLEGLWIVRDPDSFFNEFTESMRSHPLASEGFLDYLPSSDAGILLSLFVKRHWAIGTGQFSF